MPNLSRLRLQTPNSKFLGTERGQVIIEYILLMVVTVALATMIMKSVVTRDKDNPGFLMKRWQGLLTQIGKDDPNKRGP